MVVNLLVERFGVLLELASASLLSDLTPVAIAALKPD